MNRNELFKYIEDRTYQLREASRNRKHETRDAGDNFPDHTLASAMRHFFNDVYSKAREARDKYNLPELGWATPDWEQELQQGIAEHLQKGDPRDVAVYAMFAWFHGWSTATPALQATGEAAAPASDELLAKLEKLAEDTTNDLPWAQYIKPSTEETVFYRSRQDEGRNPYEMAWFTHNYDGDYALAICNAGPALLARVWQAEAKANFQSRVGVWMQETFGPEVSADFTERGFRFGEEAIELLQANGTTKEDVLKLVDYVYSRPVGKLPQEVGGVMVTLASLCEARGIDLLALADQEQTRVEHPDVRAKIQAKQEDKRRRMIATPLPGSAEGAITILGRNLDGATVTMGGGKMKVINSGPHQIKVIAPDSIKSDTEPS